MMREAEEQGAAMLDVGFCVCDFGFNGSNCEYCDRLFFGPNCLQCQCVHGSCDDGIDGSGECNCYEWYWIDATCSVNIVLVLSLVFGSILFLSTIYQVRKHRDAIVVRWIWFKKTFCCCFLPGFTFFEKKKKKDPQNAGDLQNDDHSSQTDPLLGNNNNSGKKKKTKKDENSRTELEENTPNDSMAGAPSTITSIGHSVSKWYEDGDVANQTTSTKFRDKETSSRASAAVIAAAAKSTSKKSSKKKNDDSKKNEENEENENRRNRDGKPSATAETPTTSSATNSPSPNIRTAANDDDGMMNDNADRHREIEQTRITSGALRHHQLNHHQDETATAVPPSEVAVQQNQPTQSQATLPSESSGSRNTSRGNLMSRRRSYQSTDSDNDSH